MWQVAEGQAFGAALLSDGTVDTWGYDGDGELGDGRIAPVYRLSPAPVPGLDGVVQIAAGYQHVLALKSVWAWGNNAFGQLGVGTTTSHAAPVQVPGLTGVTQVAAGQTHSLAIAGPGSSVWAWGDDSSSQLGDGATKEQKSPVNIGLNGITQISAGFNQSAAVSSNDVAYSWGANGILIDSGQSGPVSVPSPIWLPNNVDGVTEAVQVSLGGGSTLAVGISAATVPDVTGDTLQQAAAALAAAGLTVGQKTNVIDCDNRNRVSSETPGADTLVAPGSPVDLKIGQPPVKTLCP